MSKLEAPYNLLGHQYATQDYFGKKCKYFSLGFTAALVVTLLGGLVFQLYMSPSNVVTVSSGRLTHRWPEPPPHDQVAKVARYVVHISEWASISTISTHSPIKGYPFGNILSISDGTVDRSSGTPYAYITRLDLSGKDLLSDNRATLTFSEAQSDYCQKHDLDPEDPRCSRIQMSGTMEEIKNGTSEAEFAKAALFSRHPVMASWPEDHHWIFMKLNIEHIYVMDFFGGAREVDAKDYYNAEF